MAGQGQQGERLVVVGHSGFGSQQWDAIRAAIEPVGGELVLKEWRDEAGLIAAARDAVALVQGGHMAITGKTLDALPKLRFIGAAGIGVDFVDLPAATERGVVVFNLPGVIHREVAAHAMALLLCLVRQIIPANEAVKSGQWRPQRRSIPHLYGQTLGLLSFGSIPRTVAREAQAFDMQVIAHDPFVPDDVIRAAGVEPVGMDDLFRRSDFVSVHTPLSPETYHLVGERHFRLMKPSAYFINTGRGKVVDEAALIRALQEGWIAAAGLDVLEQEPAARDNPLLKMDNVILTPHMASASDFAGVERRKRLGEELARCLAGHWPKYGLVNRGVRPKQPLTEEA
jgi:D-3-phosphoglycerate dehydrogenase